MDTTIVLSAKDTGDNQFFDVSNCENGDELVAKLIGYFGSIENINPEVNDFAVFPENILKWDNGREFEEMTRNLVDYLKAVNDIPDYQEDAFKTYFEEYGGVPTELVKEFSNKFSGEFQDVYDFGVDMAQSGGLNLQGFESFFNFEGFGQSCANDYIILKDIYYFRG